jgi:hypothetical protein
MANPHYKRKVGYSMIVVSASLTIVALIGLAIGSDVLFGDKIQRAETKHFEECKANNFVDEGCEIFQPYLNNDVSKIYLESEKGS